MKIIIDLFWTFFKLGLFTIGGGYAMIAGIKEIIVEKKKWLTEEELLEIIIIAESTPGPIAINMATYVGYKKKKLLGSLASTLGVVIPSMIIIFLISLFFDNLIKYKIIKYAFIGIKCGVAFLIIKAGINMLIKMPKNFISISTYLILMIVIFAFEIFSISFLSIYYIIIGGIIGIVYYSLIMKKDSVNL